MKPTKFSINLETGLFEVNAVSKSVEKLVKFLGRKDKTKTMLVVQHLLLPGSEEDQKKKENKEVKALEFEKD